MNHLATTSISQSHSGKDIDLLKLTEKILADKLTLGEIEGKNNILFMGKPGAGKTATICFITGEKMEIRMRREERLDGISTFVEYLDTVKPVDGFTIGHDYDSTTKVIRSRPLSGTEQRVTDSCGFLAPEGTTIDLANAVTLRNAMRLSLQLLPVVTIDARVVSIDRGGPFEDLLDLVLRFFSPIEDFLPSMSFLFTHGSPELRADKLLTDLSRLSKSAHINNDRKKIVIYLFDYVKAYSDRCILLSVDLVSLDAAGEANTLRRRNDLIALLQAPPALTHKLIQRLGCPISNEVQESLKVKCYEIELLISHDLSIFSYRPVCDHMNLLHILESSVNLEFITEIWDSCLDLTKRHFLIIFQEVDRALDEKDYESLGVYLIHYRESLCLRSFGDYSQEYKQRIDQIDEHVKCLSTIVIDRTSYFQDTKIISEAFKYLESIQRHLKFALYQDADNQGFDFVLCHVKKHFSSINHRCDLLLTLLSEMITSPPDSEIVARTEDRRLIELCGPVEQTDVDDSSAQQPSISFPVCILFHDLIELEASIAYQVYIEEVLTYSQERKNQFLTLLQIISTILLGENGILFAIRDLTLTEKKSHELSRISHLLQIFFTSGRVNQRIPDGHNHWEMFVKELIEYSISHLNTVDSSLLVYDYASIQYPLRVLVMLELDDSSFTQFQSNTLLPKVQLVRNHIKILFERCQGWLETIRSTTCTQKGSSVIPSMETSLAQLQSACCLDFLYSPESDATPSQCYSELLFSIHEVWTNRLSHFKSILSSGDPLNIIESFVHMESMVGLSEVLSDIAQDIRQVRLGIEQAVDQVIGMSVTEIIELSEEVILDNLTRVDFYLSFLSQHCCGSNLFSKYDPTDWCDLTKKLESWKIDFVNFIQTSVDEAKVKSFEALQEKNASQMNFQLASLKRFLCFDDFMNQSSSSLYDSTRFAILTQIENMISEAKAALRRGYVNRVAPIRVFLEDLSLSGTHFDGFDFRIHLVALMNDHYEVVGRIPKEVETLLESKRFVRIRSKLLMAQQTASDVFEECDLLLTEYFQVFEENVQGQVVVLSTETINKFISDFAIIQKAQCLSGVISYDLMSLSSCLCSTIYALFCQLQSDFNYFMNAYNFGAASRKFEQMRCFEFCDTILSKTVSKNSQAEGHHQSYRDRMSHIWKTSVASLNTKLFEDCEGILGVVPLTCDSDGMDYSLILKVDLMKLHFLFKSVVTATSQRIFQEMINFTEIQLSLNTHICQHIGNFFAQIPHLITRNKLDLAEALINLCQNIFSCCECSLNPQSVLSLNGGFEKHRKDLRAARDLEERIPMGFQARWMDENKRQLEALRDQGFEQYSEAYQSFVKIFEDESANITSIINNPGSISTMNKKTLEILIHFSESLFAFKEKIARGKETSSCEALMDNLEIFFFDLCSHWKYCQIGAVSPLISLISSSQYQILPIFRKKGNEIFEMVREIQRNVFDVTAKLESYNMEVINFDLFISQDILGLISKLRFFRDQMIDLSQEETKCQRYYANAIKGLETSLNQSVSRFEDYLSKGDFNTAATGMTNLLKLSEVADLGDICRVIEEEFRFKIATLTSQIVESVTIGMGQYDLKDLDHLIITASLIDQEFKYCMKERVPATTEILELFDREFTNLVSVTRSSLEGHCDTIMSIKSLVSEISHSSIQSLAAEYIDRYLNQLKDLKADLWNLSVLLTDAGPFGEEVVSKHSQFRRMQVRRFNQAAPPLDIDHALRELQSLNKTINDAQIRRLKKIYMKYLSSYKAYLSQYLRGYSSLRVKSLEDLVTEIQEIAKGENPQNRLSDILAGVFALWTIKTSEEDFQESKEHIDLKQPHVTQVLAILRLLGLDQGTSFLTALFQLLTGPSKTISGHLIQMGTGEGKSILLAGLSCVLALLGYEVHCACYSQHLSDRDAEAFSPLFDELGILSMIKYSTLGSLVERVIRGDELRAEVRNCLIPSESSRNSKKSESVSDPLKIRPEILPRIFLIDEVDIFLSSNFLGATYNPVASYSSSETEALFRFIWDNRQQNPTLSAVQELQEYRDLVARVIPAGIALVDSEVKKMLNDVHRFNQPPYEVVEQKDGSWKIGYKKLDSVSFSTSYRYRTAFAYLHEMSKRAESQASIGHELALKIYCGAFSYAEVPCPDGLSPFQCIMGVTGTLDSLSETERTLVTEKYGVTNYTFSPSMYGKSNLQFKPVGDVIMETDVDRYYQTILKDILDEREKGRAVLVYFDDEIKMDEFLESCYGSQLEDVHVVTEKTDNIPFYVERATRTGMVTLLTRMFGRGLDFICHAAVDKACGVHVIQTFFSELPSEQRQIQGRTARRKKKGSYKLILLLRQLEKQLQMTAEELTALDRTDRFYDTLHAKRLELLSKTVEAQIRKTEESKALHEKSFRFLEALRSGNASPEELVTEILSFGR